MATIQLPPDFKDFLKLLNSEPVEYLVVGGYAVGVHGYPRATGDLDVWVPINDSTAKALGTVLRKFGLSAETIGDDFELHERQILRMGLPPLRIEVLTSPSGVDFEECYARRETVVIDDLEFHVIGLTDLKVN